jgi:predicted RNA binding protein YcfA (HicA-like mRNA interferase family)
VGKYDKLLYKILSGRSDSNIAFSELMQLLQRLGFDLRIRGDHHIFTRQDIVEILNLQPAGSMAKPYQVKQVRQVIVKYQLGVIDE